ncbi:MAG: hypothetical protein DRP55_10585, partial [Spirochaetes bacterium]
LNCGNKDNKSSSSSKKMPEKDIYKLIKETRLLSVFKGLKERLKEDVEYIVRNISSSSYTCFLSFTTISQECRNIKTIRQKGNLSSMNKSLSLEVSSPISLSLENKIKKALKDLESEDRYIRRLAREFLEKQMSSIQTMPVGIKKTVINSLVEFWIGERWFPRESVESLLIKIGCPVIYPLISILKNKGKYSGPVRGSAIHILREIGSKKDIPQKFKRAIINALAESLRDENSLIHSESAYSLEKLNWKPKTQKEEIYYLFIRLKWNELLMKKELLVPAVPILREVLKNEATNFNISYLIKFLAKIASEKIIPIKFKEDVVNDLTMILKNRRKSASQRASAAEALAQIVCEGDILKDFKEIIVNTLLEVLQKDSEILRKTHIAFYQDFLKSEKEDAAIVGRSIIEALGQIVSQEDISVKLRETTINILIKILKDEVLHLCSFVQDSLIRIGVPGVCTLLKILEDENLQVRQFAGEILKNILTKASINRNEFSQIIRTNPPMWILFLIYDRNPQLFKENPLKILLSLIKEELKIYSQQEYQNLLEQFSTAINLYLKKRPKTESIEESYKDITSLLRIVHSNLLLCLKSLCRVNLRIRDIERLIKVLPINNPLTRIIKMFEEDVVRRMIENRTFRYLYNLILDIAKQEKRLAPAKIEGLLSILGSYGNSIKHWGKEEWRVFASDIREYSNRG